VSRPFLTAAWRYLVMFNYEVPAAVLEPLVPRGTELDRWNGATLASLVGFQFLDTRVLGVPIPGHRNFDEVNLRFYVRRRAADGSWRRAVVFIRELVPRRAIAWAARRIYNEPYLAVPMRHVVDLTAVEQGGEGRISYRWRWGGRWHRLEATVRGTPSLPSPESEASFITEHYWGYTAQRDGGTQEYRVEHPSWRVWSGLAPTLECDVGEVYGPPFAAYLSSDPLSVYVADGSLVKVHVGRRLATASSEQMA
jgi:uncharacterized protein YqjF (DUF2071 family)